MKHLGMWAISLVCVAAFLFLARHLHMNPVLLRLFALLLLTSLLAFGLLYLLLAMIYRFSFLAVSAFLLLKGSILFIAVFICRLLFPSRHMFAAALALGVYLLILAPVLTGRLAAHSRKSPPVKSPVIHWFFSLCAAGILPLALLAVDRAWRFLSGA